MSEWINTLAPHVADALRLNPIDRITDKFAEKFRQQAAATLDGDDEIEVFERFITSVSSNNGKILLVAILDAQTNASADSKRLLRDLLIDLASCPVACLLITGPDANLESDIWNFLPTLATNSIPTLDTRRWALLVMLAVTGATVGTIWRALLDIFSCPSSVASSVHVSSITPGGSNTRIHTPISSNSNSCSNRSETHQVIDQNLRQELDGILYTNIPGFIDTYFSHQQSVVDQVLEQAKSGHLSPTGWTTWPSPPIQDRVLNWFTSSVNALLPDSTPYRYATSPNNPLPNAIAKRKPDIYLCGRDPPHDWSDVLVVGELKQSMKDTLGPTAIVEFAGYVRLIFLEQPYRRFVHGFTLCGEMIRCWIFHRGGGFSSEHFSINSNPRRFLSVVVGYARMSREDLGYDPTVTLPGVTGLRNVMMSGQQYELKGDPFFVTPAIACRGTTCTETKLPGDNGFNYVCKDAWRSHSYVSEGMLLLEAQTAGVVGLVEYIDHEDVHIDSVLDDISGNVMKGLSLIGMKPLALRPIDSRTTITSSRTSRPSAPKRRTTDSVPKRRTTDSTRSIRSRSPLVPRKRAQPRSGPLPPNKRTMQITALDTPIFFNRVHTRLITSKGRPIYQFTSNLELLLALRDAIIGHRSLLRYGILHRDVSLANIMITLAPRRDNLKGFLIDLDLALRLDCTTDSTTHHRTGTMEFMAIGALYREPHTYRHDLESFFYVFLWICIHYLPGGKRVKPYPTVLDRWGSLGYTDAAARKRSDMEPGGFEALLHYFTHEADELKNCARGIRAVLFPWRDLLWTGTDVEFEGVYEGVLKVIGIAVKGLELEG